MRNIFLFWYSIRKWQLCQKCRINIYIYILIQTHFFQSSLLSAQTVNIPNAYEDDRFDANVDIEGNFKHKSILCMAIKNSLGQIIGVIQLINKFDDLVCKKQQNHLYSFIINFEFFFTQLYQNFTKNDENFVEAFAIFCGMGIHNTHMYEKAIVAMAKQSVTLEVLSYHASATIDEAHRLRVSLK